MAGSSEVVIVAAAAPPKRAVADTASFARHKDRVAISLGTSQRGRENEGAKG